MERGLIFMIKVAINGFGRIGRTAVRILAEKYADKIELVAINTSGSMEVEGWAHLLKYDSTYGRFNRQVKFTKLHPVAEGTDNDPVIGQLMI